MKKKILKIAKAFGVIAIVVLIIVSIFSCDANKYDSYERMLVERADSELVRVRFGEKTVLSAYPAVYGYIDMDDLEAFNNATLSSNVKIYHPYEKAEYVLVNADEIVWITVFESKDFVRECPPY